MRLRNVRNASDLINKHPNWVITNPVALKGKWTMVFGNDKPIYLEIGCGKGKFIFEMAKKHPNINFIGIEKFDSVIVRALQKIVNEPLDNVRLLRIDAAFLTSIFAINEISCVYLNFSDPWPKPSHARRRLTSPQYLERYRAVLQPLSSIFFKTDNFPLFSFSMMSFVNSGLKINHISLDCHREQELNNVETEFETRFSTAGKPIYYIKAQYKESNDDKAIIS
ncbi:MAG: tRNA (guanosine(46)-N7)-methyltransferase TrmB [Candidatus Izemoplasmatales bacterium]|jgi:tRNA (guanine-N7-)-methyltransferase